MLRSLSTLSRAATLQSSAPLSFVAFYSVAAGLGWSKWQTAGPRPRSLAADPEPEPAPAEPAAEDEPVPGRAARMRSQAAGSPTPRTFLAHRTTLKKSFPEGWAPPRKLSRDAMDGLRMLHAHDPETFSTPVLAAKFKISPEAVRRILKSKWEPSKEEKAKLLQRERRNKEEWIAARRAEERERQRELLKLRRGAADDKLTLT